MPVSTFKKNVRCEHWLQNSSTRSLPATVDGFAHTESGSVPNRYRAAVHAVALHTAEIFNSEYWPTLEIWVRDLIQGH